MNDFNDFSSNYGINIVDDCLIVKLPVEVNEDSIISVSEEIMNTVTKSRFLGVIFDFGSVTIIDSFEFNKLRELILMIRMFGIMSVLAGLQPGVVSALVDMDVETNDLKAFLNLETALNYIVKELSTHEAINEVEEIENQDEYDISPDDEE